MRRRRFAAAFACLESARCEAELLGSRSSLRRIALDRFGDAFRRDVCPARYARAALFLVRADAFPFPGGFSLTPARLAFDSPIAIACFADRAPCFPSRMCSISSRTNSPACVVGDFPSRLAFCARLNVCRSGMTAPLLTAASKTPANC